FPVHPRKVINSNYSLEILTTYDEKTKILAETGIDYCIIHDFTLETSLLSAQEFMTNILHKQCNVQTLVVGYDHRFGHNRSESCDDYLRYGRELGMEVVLADAHTSENMNISSSTIRSLLHKGEVNQAADCLGYNYSLTGTVIEGHQIGRTLGFPTANIQVKDSGKLIPANGVYGVRVTVNEKSYTGMLNIGQRPTINNGTYRSIEVHIFHFHSDIYNSPIQVSFVQRIRQEEKFSTIEELTAQLHKDSATIEALLNN
ncbi:Riboflavin biosynthesis protein RibF, partial [termite gut metagenome]